MECLYIQVVDGQTVNHPALESNLIAAFDSVPEDWQPFTRGDQPPLVGYQVYDPPYSSYQFINGSWTDVWTIRDMTDAEKYAIQQPVKDAWAARPYASNFTAWVYNEASNTYEPPFPRPTDGQIYRWNGADNNWKIAPEAPNKGQSYTFDFTSWVWVPSNGA